MDSLRWLRDLVGGDWTKYERIGQIQVLKYDNDEPTGKRIPKGNGTPRRVAHVNRRIFAPDCGLNLFRCQPMLCDVRHVAALVIQIIPIEQGIL
ncbi:MAG TPA: hypothetical protein VGP68_16905 [Gemmataceae bacterium]|nr:hypothetical protein [Gemmataceae bacterium]